MCALPFFTVGRSLQIGLADADRREPRLALAFEAVEQGQRQSGIDAGAHVGIENDSQRRLPLSRKLHGGASLTKRYSRAVALSVAPKGIRVDIPAWLARPAQSEAS